MEIKKEYLPVGWQIKSLREVCTLVKRGISPKYTDDINELTVINQRCIRDHKINFELARNHNESIKSVNLERLIQAGDVLVNSTGTGTLGRVAQVSRQHPRATVDTHVTIVRPKTDLFDPNFFGYAMILIESEIEKAGEGTSGQTELRRTKLNNEFNIIYPTSLNTQRAIVARLDAAFARIDRARANLERNVANARELFQAKLNEVFSRRGDGWEEKPLKEICTLVNGKAYKRAELLQSGKYPVLRVGNLFTGKQWYYSNLELKPNKYVDNGDLIYAWSASFGPRIWEGGKVIYHYHIWKVIPKPSLVDKQFLYHILDWDTEQIKSAHGTGTTMMHVGKGSMEARTLPVPPLQEQVSIVEEIDQLHQIATDLEKRYQHQIENLTHLKQSLLQKAFRGELIAEAEGEMVVDHP